MMDNIHTFTYCLGNKVRINNTTRTGIIDLCAIDHGGEHYLVCIEDNDGNIKSRWYRTTQISTT